MNRQGTRQANSSVGEQLLAVVRAETGDARLQFSEEPKQLAGGFDTLTYSFRLSASDGVLAGPLILRLFPQPTAKDQARREKAIQNSLADLGYPVPRVFLQRDSGIDGLPLNIMERIPGHSMMEEADLSPDNIKRMMTWLAEVHVRLHKIPSGPVIQALEQTGFAFDRFSFENRFTFLSRYFESETFEGLRPGFEWLEANRPAERKSLAVCHGDFHPGNIMVNDEGEVTGVIDGPAAAFADPEMDVATTLVLIKVGAGNLEPDLRQMVNALAEMYLGVYSDSASLDMVKVEYHQAFRCFRAFLRATALRTPGVDPVLVPRDHYPWQGEFAMNMAVALFKDVTGVELPLPAA